MKLIRPYIITSTELTTNILESNPSAYVGGTEYAAGVYVLYSNKIYQSLQADNTGNQPDTSPTWWALVMDELPAAYNAGTPYGDGDTVSDLTNHLTYESLQAANTGEALTDTDWWLELGSTEPWKMFDQYVGTQSEWYEEIDVTIDYDGIVDALTIQEVDAATIQVVVDDPDDGIVYDETYTMLDDSVSDYYDYFFADYEIKRNLTLMDLPPYANATVQVIITEAGATVKCGNLIVGQSADIGLTKYGPRIGIIDYSKKEIDSFGRAYLSQGPFAKRISVDLHIYNSNIDYVYRTLSGIRATATVFVGDSQYNEYEALTVFGFYRDFEITIPGPSLSACTLEVEGFI